MARQRKSTDFSVWKDYFRDPFLWHYDQSNKCGSPGSSPAFRHRITSEALSIDACSNSSWVLEELKRRMIHLTKVYEDPEEENGSSDGDHKENASLVSLLKDCAQRKDLYQGTVLHATILERRLLENNPYLASSVINMYAKCGALAKAQEVLDELPSRDHISWNAIMAGYAQHGQGREALDCFSRMQNEGMYADTVTLICILKACGSIGALPKGKQIHEDIVNRGLLDDDIVLGTALVDMYAKCGVLTQAQQVFEELPTRNIVSWNALISGYAQHCRFHEALDCFEQMQNEGIAPNRVTFASILKASGSVGAVSKGKEIHDEIVNRGLLKNDKVLGTAVVDMYAKCGLLQKAQKVLEELSARNEISWSALIAGYAEQGQGQEALNCLKKMQSEGFSPDVVTLVSLLKACGRTGSVTNGKQIHDDIMNKALLKNHVVLGNALIDMYAKCGMLVKAQQVLKELPVRNVASWNALIAAFSQFGKGDEALNAFDLMQKDGISPDMSTFSSILKACASMGAIDQGERIHDEIVSRGLLERNVILGTALVDMYAKCGILVKAQQILEELPVRDVVSWNALIAGYAQKGHGYRALACFTQMQNEGLSPNAVTLLCVMSACNFSGLLNEAQIFFGNLTHTYDITPGVEHQTCMVVALGVAGQFDEALSIVKAMPLSHYAVVWITLLRACREWGNMKLAWQVFDQTLKIQSSYAVV